jgi:hypothetical protein
MANITEKDLILIHDTVFGAKKSLAETERKFTGNNIPAYISAKDFCVSDEDYYETFKDNELEFLTGRFKEEIKELEKIKEKEKDYIIVKSLKQLREVEEDNRRHIRKTRPKEWWWLGYAINEDTIKPIRKQLERRNKKSSNTLNIEKAKQFPMTDLIDFKYRTAKCLWHQEREGSLYYYPKDNRCHCFGACGKSFSVIDVYMKINNCTFVEAVKKLQ